MDADEIMALQKGLQANCLLQPLAVVGEGCWWDDLQQPASHFRIQRHRCPQYIRVSTAIHRKPALVRAGERVVQLTPLRQGDESITGSMHDQRRG